MNTGVITKENEFIPIPYYEIGTFAERVCDEYIEKSEANKIKFETFAKDYSFFKPYLDFLLFELGYKIVNPLLHYNSIWSVENNELLLKSSSDNKHYVPVCDKSLEISYINPEDIHTCMIDLDGRIYEINRELELHHENVCELVLNQYLIYDKELFEIYQEYISNNITNVMSFAKNMLGFLQLEVLENRSAIVVYCKDFHNSYINNVLLRIKELYPDFTIESYTVHTEESLKVANKCIERVNKTNENRRLRF